jgi:hypothetical protein
MNELRHCPRAKVLLRGMHVSATSHFTKQQVHINFAPRSSADRITVLYIKNYVESDQNSSRSVFVSSHNAVTSSCDFPPDHHLLVQTFSLNIMGPMENPRPFPQTTHTRPCLPSDLWKHGRDPPHVRASPVKANVFGPRHTSPSVSFLPRVVGSVRKAVTVLVWVKAQIGYSRSGYDQGGPNGYGPLVSKDSDRPFH